MISNGIKGFTGRIRPNRRVAIGQKSAKGYPEKLDHFQFRRRVDGYSWEVDTALHRALGEKPQSVDIEFLSDKVGRVFRYGLACFAAKRQLFCYGNGEKASRQVSATGRREEIDCPYRDCEYHIKKRCKPHGTLLFQIPGAGPGIFDFRTTSYYTIGNLEEKLALLEARGVIAGLPLQLRVSPLSVKRQGHDGLTKIYVVDLDWDEGQAGVAREQLAAIRRVSWAPNPSGPAAPNIPDADAEDLEDFASEFHPDSGREPDSPPRLEPGPPPPAPAEGPPSPGLPPLDLPEPPPGFAF